MKAIPFLKEHLEMIDPQAYQSGVLSKIDDDHLLLVEKEYSFSIVDGESVIACGGIAKVSDGRGVAWAYMGNRLSDKMVGVTRIAKTFLAKSNFHRIEAHVECDFLNGHRWAKALGFSIELDRMRAFTDSKKDCSLYSIVR